MKPERNPIRFRVICRPIPPGTYQGKPTEFGARHKDGMLIAGKPIGDSLAFTIDADWTFNAKTRRPVFYGPFVFKTGDAQSLYLRWMTVAPPRDTISAVKVHLETIERALLEKAARTGGVLETRADTPRWGVDHNWHGLGVGLRWELKK